jgi:hypothetical protein
MAKDAAMLREALCCSWPTRNGSPPLAQPELLVQTS